LKPAENLPKEKKTKNKQTNNGDIEVIDKVALYVGLVQPSNLCFLPNWDTIT
jgi:hypothetical protein